MGKNMGKRLENSVFIATFVGDSTKNLYSKNRNREKKQLTHNVLWRKIYIKVMY